MSRLWKKSNDLCGPLCKSLLTRFLRRPFNSPSVSPPLSPSWWRCVSVSRVESWPVPTFSVSTPSFSCRWTRRSPRGLAPSATSPPPSRCSSSTGEEFSKPALTSPVCSFVWKGWRFVLNCDSTHRVSTEQRIPLNGPRSWREGVYLWCVVSLLLPSCPPNQHSGACLLAWSDLLNLCF